MKVFISWSRKRGQELALYLREWLVDANQMIEPRVSSKDIQSGSKWRQELEQHLKECQFAVVCLTKETKMSPWIHFEAGIISSKDSVAMCPYLLDVDPGNVPETLRSFHCESADEAGTFKLLKAINERVHAVNGKSVDENVLKRQFDRIWPDLKEKISKIKAIPPEDSEVFWRAEGGKVVNLWDSKGVYSEAENLVELIDGSKAVRVTSLTRKDVPRDGGHQEHYMVKMAYKLKELAEKGIDVEYHILGHYERRNGLLTKEARDALNARMQPFFKAGVEDKLRIKTYKKEDKWPFDILMTEGRVILGFRKNVEPDLGAIEFGIRIADLDFYKQIKNWLSPIWLDSGTEIWPFEGQRRFGWRPAFKRNNK